MRMNKQWKKGKLRRRAKVTFYLFTISRDLTGWFNRVLQIKLYYHLSRFKFLLSRFDLFLLSLLATTTLDSKLMKNNNKQQRFLCFQREPGVCMGRQRGKKPTRNSYIHQRAEMKISTHDRKIFVYVFENSALRSDSQMFKVRYIVVYVKNICLSMKHDNSQHWQASIFS